MPLVENKDGKKTFTNTTGGNKKRRRGGGVINRGGVDLHQKFNPRIPSLVRSRVNDPSFNKLCPGLRIVPGFA